MDWSALIQEHGVTGAAAIVLCGVVYWLIKWIRELVEARHRDAERFADRAIEREREMIASLNDLTNAIKSWSGRDNSK